MFLSGWVIDRWGVEWVLIGGSLLTAVAVALLALSQTYQSALAVTFLMGIAGACVITGSNVLMPQGLSPSNPAAALNLGNVFFVLGILLAPVAANLLIQLVPVSPGAGAAGPLLPGAGRRGRLDAGHELSDLWAG